MSLIGDLKWRYATKKYDASKIVSVETIAYIKEAIQLSVSSYGLQAYKILIIEDKAIREKLKLIIRIKYEINYFISLVSDKNF